MHWLEMRSFKRSSGRRNRSELQRLHRATTGFSLIVDRTIRALAERNSILRSGESPVFVSARNLAKSCSSQQMRRKTPGGGCFLSGGGDLPRHALCQTLVVRVRTTSPIEASPHFGKGVAVKIDSLRKLFVHELKDLYSAERQLTRSLPGVIRHVNDKQLRDTMQEHLKETKNQIRRLEHIFTKLEFEPGGHRCKAMAGLLREAKNLLKEDIEPEVLDAGLIGAIQRIEHYEIAGYGTARSFAEKLGEQAAADLLQESLNEEAGADQKLSRMAERSINFEALVAT